MTSQAKKEAHLSASCDPVFKAKVVAAAKAVDRSTSYFIKAGCKVLMDNPSLITQEGTKQTQ